MPNPTSSTIPYKGIAFDIDGTLYPEGSLRLLPMVSPMITRPKLFQAYRKTRKSLREFDYTGSLREEQARRVGELLGISLAQAEDRIEKELYHPWDRGYRRIKPFSGVYNLLAELHRRGVPMGSLSDFPISHKLETLGVADFFSFAISSEDTEYLKPHKAPFLALAQGMNLNPEEILYVGNSYTKDVLGAAAVGMGTVLLGKLPRNSSVIPTLVLSNYTNGIQEILKLLSL